MIDYWLALYCLAGLLIIYVIVFGNHLYLGFESPLSIPEWLSTLTFLGTFWNTRQNWRKREFWEELNVSLNTIERFPSGSNSKPKLKFRTLHEASLASIFRTEKACVLVSTAVTKTTALDPILRIQGEDNWLVRNTLINEMSSMFKHYHVEADVEPSAYKKVKYVIALTAEKYPEVKTKKVRVMMIQKTELDYVKSLTENDLQFEAPSHKRRLETLQKIPTNSMNSDYCCDIIEVSVRIPCSCHLTQESDRSSHDTFLTSYSHPPSFGVSRRNNTYSS